MKNALKKMLADKNFWVFVATVGIVALGSTSAFAQSENIENSLNKVTTWTIRVAGGFGFLGGAIWTGLMMMAHDEHALKKGGKVCLGGAIVMMAPWLLSLMQTFFR